MLNNFVMFCGFLHLLTEGLDIILLSLNELVVCASAYVSGHRS